MIYWIVIFFFKVSGWLFFRHRVFFECDPKSISGAAIIAPNHASYLDPPLVSASWPRSLHFFAGKRLFNKWWLKWLLPRLNSHPVEEGKELATMRLALDLLAEGKKIVVFPEGTRSHDGRLGPMRSGVAFLSYRSEAPIVPCYISGTYEAWPRTQKKVQWRGRRTKCVFGKPIYPVDEQGHKRSKQTLTLLIEQELKRLRDIYRA